MRYAGMFVVGLLMVGVKLAHTAHAIHALERVSVATYSYVTGHHAQKEGRQGAHL
jgi:hypothetical protein